MRFLFCCLILGASCNSGIHETFCYEVNSTDGSDPQYFEIHKIYQQKERRIDSVLVLKMNLDTLASYREIYEVGKYGLSKLMEGPDDVLLPFLSIETKDCIRFLSNGTLDELAREYCYLGTEEIRIGKISYKDAHKFKETELFSGLISLVYFDRNFVRLKQTYITEIEPNLDIVLTEFCPPTR